MTIDICEQPLTFSLVGLSGAVCSEQYGPTGLALMNQLWPAVKTANLANTGINHWVYLGQDQLFVGVELTNPHPTPLPAPLTRFEFRLERYLRHLHRGPYDLLPATWRRLLGELQARGETVQAPSLEVYGHHSDNPAELETMIYIGLRSV